MNAQTLPRAPVQAAQLVSRITPSTIVKEKLVRLDVGPDGKPASLPPVHLYDLFGIAHGTRAGKGRDDKTWLQFKGMFEAVTSEGVVYASGRCHVPPMVEEMLYGQIADVQSEDAKAQVRFAFRIGIKAPTPGKVSATGYEFTCSSLLPPAESNPMTELRQLAAATGAAQLAGPQSGSQKESAAKK